MPSAPPPDSEFARRQTIGESIQDARLRAGLTQEALAHRVEIDRPSIVLIEQGRRNFTINTLIRIARALGVPLRDLVG